MNDNNPDQDLRDLFAETAAGIRPRGTLDDIRTRTEKVDPMTRRWFLPAMTAAAVMTLVIGGSFWFTQRSDDTAAGPAGTPSGSAAPITEQAVPVYYLGAAAQGDRLYREFQKQRVCATAECLATAAARTAVSGAPFDPDYRTPWPAGTDVAAATWDGDVLTVDVTGDDLADRPQGLDEGAAGLAIEQLIYSAQGGLGQGRVPVQLLLNGERTPTVLGVATSEPLAAGDELDVLAPVQISSPTDGQTLPAGTVTVTGVAAAFEATVSWELLVGGDAVVQSGFATAAECCKLAPYEFTVQLEPGRYTLVVHDTDESGLGNPMNQDTKELVVE